MPDKDFLADLDPTGLNWTRTRLTTVRGRVVSFTVQYETLIDGVVTPVIRYDTAHGTPHMDFLARSGALVDKRWLLDMTNEQALTFAKADIKRNWEDYRRRFS